MHRCNFPRKTSSALIGFQNFRVQFGTQLPSTCLRPYICTYIRTYICTYIRIYTYVRMKISTLYLEFVFPARCDVFSNKVFISPCEFSSPPLSSVTILREWDRNFPEKCIQIRNRKIVRPWGHPYPAFSTHLPALKDGGNLIKVNMKVCLHPQRYLSSGTHPRVQPNFGYIFMYAVVCTSSMTVIRIGYTRIELHH